MLTAKMCFSNKYELMSSIAWTENASLNYVQSIGYWWGRCIKIEYHLDLHILADGDNIHTSGVVLADL